jgi:uracil-DNA glycosylase family 4
MKPSGTSDTQKKFESLTTRVHACKKCARMASSQRVLSNAIGPLDAPLLFIGEAPGRLGADESGIPFHGDQAGHNFEELLDRVGLSRYAVAVTNSVLCNPRDFSGTNATPTSEEIRNCSDHLRRQVDIIERKIVVTLGATALKAVEMIEHHGLELSKSVRTCVRWYRRLLVPLYHPGQRAMIHRSFANQLADYQFVAEQLVRLRKKPRSHTGSPLSETIPIVRRILTLLPQTSYFGLHKLFYLIEWSAVRNNGGRLTKAYIVRQKDGPYCTDLHISKLKKGIPELIISKKQQVLTLALDKRDLFAAESRHNIESSIVEIVDNVVRAYGTLSDAELKRVVYLSRPMRKILRAERDGPKSMFNVPIVLDQ